MCTAYATPATSRDQPEALRRRDIATATRGSGPNQPGVNETDPSDPARVRARSGRRAARRARSEHGRLHARRGRCRKRPRQGRQGSRTNNRLRPRSRRRDPSRLARRPEPGPVAAAQRRRLERRLGQRRCRRRRCRRRRGRERRGRERLGRPARARPNRGQVLSSSAAAARPVGLHLGVRRARRLAGVLRRIGRSDLLVLGRLRLVRLRRLCPAAPQLPALAMTRRRQHVPVHEPGAGRGGDGADRDRRGVPRLQRQQGLPFVPTKQLKVDFADGVEPRRRERRCARAAIWSGWSSAMTPVSLPTVRSARR